jgi:hypothetical protein
MVRKLCSYTGLLPSTHSSGKTVSYGGITKESNLWQSSYGCANPDKCSQEGHIDNKSVQLGDRRRESKRMTVIAAAKNL